jgi:hypothetical protein
MCSLFERIRLRRKMFACSLFELYFDDGIMTIIFLFVQFNFSLCSMLKLCQKRMIQTIKYTRDSGHEKTHTNKYIVPFVPLSTDTSIMKRRYKIMVNNTNIHLTSHDIGILLLQNIHSTEDGCSL